MVSVSNFRTGLFGLPIARVHWLIEGSVGITRGSLSVFDKSVLGRFERLDVCDTRSVSSQGWGIFLNSG